VDAETHVTEVDAGKSRTVLPVVPGRRFVLILCEHGETETASPFWIRGAAPDKDPGSQTL
jgi:hypothetical protein